MDYRDEYMKTLGEVPPAIVAMLDMEEELADVHTRLRKLIYADRDQGLNLAVKELMLIALDVVVGNTAGAINHLRAAHRAGATGDQLKETLLCVYLVFGVSRWGLSGHRVWEEWQQLASSQEGEP